MNRSITRRFFLVILISILSLLLIISGIIRFFLPEYYLSSKLAAIDSYMLSLSEAVDDPIELASIINDIETNLGGQVDIIDKEGNQKGYGKGKNANAGNQKNANTYILPDGQTSEFNTEYTNRYGINFKVYGIPVGSQWILYQIPIESIDETIQVFLSFYNYIIVLGMTLSLFLAYFISKSITQPILTLNNETKNLIDQRPITLNRIRREDEIGELNHSIHYLYQSLQSNIQRLDTELSKEKAADTMRKEFLAQVSHELRTPIAVIKGYAEIITDGLYSSEEKLKQFSQNIYSETEHVDALITDITDYSKMASGHFDMTLTETLISPWIEDIVSRMTPFIESNGLTLDSSITINDLTLAIDPYRMEQVIKILLNNASEHAAQAITLDALQENNHLILTCANDGPLINEKDLPFIFNSFYKSKGKQTGSGLGLAILKEIVLYHKGSYRVENTDKGVKFIIIL